MFKKYNKSIIAGVLGALIGSYGSGVFAGEDKIATITPAKITPSTVNPATVNPTTITPPVITPPVITPARINPMNTVPSTTTPSITTPTTITPAQVNPGSSSISTTSVHNPNANPTATDVGSPEIKRQFPVGMVMKARNTVDVLKKNKTVHSLKDQSLFFAHDIIVTKNDSSVALRFNDGTFIVLGPDTVLEIKEYRFTIPPKGKPYEASAKDKAQIKLYKGSLTARLGTLAITNGPNAFSILTPRGRIQLSDAKKNSDIDLIYNNKVGLVVHAIGELNNSKGQVPLTNKSYGLVSAVIGSAPTTTGSLPLAFSEQGFISTMAFFNSQVTQTSTTYLESFITQEHELLSQSDTSPENSNNSSFNLEDESGDDDGSDEDDSDEEDDDNSSIDEIDSEDNDNGGSGEDE